MRKLSFRLSALVVLTLVFSSCAGFKPKPVANASFHSRVMTQTDGKLTISVVALSPKESQEVFGMKIAKKKIQPVWLKIENHDKEDYWLQPISIDPEYFSPNESAVKNHGGHNKKAKKEMNTFFNDNQIAYYLPAGATNEGFVYSNISHGAKEVNVELLKDKELKNFSFIVPVPDIKVDYNLVDSRNIIPRDQRREVSLEQLRSELEAMPGWTANKKGEDWGGDALNLVIIGDDADIFSAFIRRGWNQAEMRYKGSSWKTLKSFLFGSLYDNAPVSDLYTFGRPQDLAFQKARRSVHYRNHLRLWMTPLTYHGEPVWLGSISRDIGVKFSKKGILFLTHRIDSDVDETRDYLLQDFMAASAVDQFTYVKGPGVVTMAKPRKNFTGDEIYTDGLRVVMFVTDKRVDMVDVNSLDWEYPIER